MLTVEKRIQVKQETWKQLAGEVGWRAVLEQSAKIIGGSARLLLRLSQNVMTGSGLKTEVVYSRVVAETPNSDEKTIGELRRKWIVVDAVAAFLNAGGTPEEFCSLLPICTERPVDVSPAYFVDVCVNRATGERCYDFAYHSDEEGETRYARWSEYVGVDYGLSVVDLDADDEVSSWVLSQRISDEDGCDWFKVLAHL